MTLKVLKRLLRVTDESATEVSGCIHHSGTLDKTLIPFDIYVKVNANGCSCCYSISASGGRVNTCWARDRPASGTGVNSIVLRLFADATSALVALLSGTPWRRQILILALCRCFKKKVCTGRLDVSCAGIAGRQLSPGSGRLLHGNLAKTCRNTTTPKLAAIQPPPPVCPTVPDRHCRGTRTRQGPSLPVGKRNSLVTFFNDILPVKMSRGEVSQCSDASARCIGYSHHVHVGHFFSCSLLARGAGRTFSSSPCSAHRCVCRLQFSVPMFHVGNLRLWSPMWCIF